ncbi:MAG: bifunctional 4'-phosphopantothenoylcysteine decarboxylase/phosphopantothenoylcysteine synthetase, partial [Firmicutes bacterium]|nr:bifunctional 4'-phosphopantothenoylcysteine decarboxylase/phosphopantothenoylcysteine synthetase [Bacillota bacterium]
AALGREKGRRILVGFAAETGELVSRARRKLEEKNLDLLVANDVTVPGAGFETDTNVVQLLYRDGRVVPLPMMTKLALAHRILDEVVRLRAASGP